MTTQRSAWSTEFKPYKDQVDGGVIRTGQLIRIQGLGDPVLNFGDGPESFEIVKATVTSVDRTLKTWVGEAKVKHTYATASKQGSAWVASFAGCCRDSDVKNRNSGYFNVTTTLHLSHASYSPIHAMLPRQIIMGGVISRANSFWIPAYDKGRHPSLGLSNRYTWRIHSKVGSLNVSDTTGQVWGHIDACPTRSPSTACLYAMRVAVTDVSSGAMSEVDFEVEVLPAAVTDMPFYLNTSATAAAVLPSVNNVFRHYQYIYKVQFRGGGWC